MALSSRAFLVDYVRVFVPFVCADPHLDWKIGNQYTKQERNMRLFLKLRMDRTLEIPTNLSECVQPCQDASPNPRSILPLRRSVDPDLHVLDRKLLDLAH